MKEFIALLVGGITIYLLLEQKKCGCNMNPSGAFSPALPGGGGTLPGNGSGAGSGAPPSSLGTGSGCNTVAAPLLPSPNYGGGDGIQQSGRYMVYDS